MANETKSEAAAESPPRGYWAEVRRRFGRRRLAMIALGYVLALGLVALLSPAIVGTKPVVCWYKGSLYFPALAYYNRAWEPVIFTRVDRFRNVYVGNLQENDPDSWAVWPLVYQDPYRRVREEWPGQPPNPTRDEGAPSRFNLLGTNRAGVDVFAQMVHGARTALVVGFVSMGVAATIGVVVGATAGFFGGWVDMALSRVIEVVMCIPSLVLILALIAVLERPTIWHLMAIIGATSWTGIARLTRAEFIRLKELDYVTAARAIGVGRWRIMFRHVLRNALAPVLVPVTFGIAAAILIESALSFLGFGAPPPNPSWGALLSAGRSSIQQMWWLIVFPGAAIFLTVLAYNLIGEGLQEATDPRIAEG
ncbi:ABC transporter permease [Botrimarina sp.]|uniref:ABC transporter permease n=1 Tax=Botrimarina sp. TaxID=2795802 RepID=UPI0032F00FAD